jgi:hypothetical protein
MNMGWKITYRLSRRSSGESSRVEDGGAHLEVLLIKDRVL